MTEPRHSELFAAMAAFRGSMLRIAGDMAVASARLGTPLELETLRGWRAERALVAEQLAGLARDLAAGIDVLTRTADGALEDTAVDGSMVELVQADTAARVAALPRKK